MKKAKLLATLEKYNFRPGKILGQNFLIDENLLDFIVRSAKPEPGEIILEAGPGFGALTRKLLEYGADVYAIEFDRRICDYLRNHLQAENFHLTEGDACRVKINEILPEGIDFRAIANLPYAISSIYIARLLELERPPVQMVFMLQKEMALRLAADPETKNYGALSVRVQAMYDVSILRQVPPQVFYPPPEVDSAIVDFKLKPQRPPLKLCRELSKVVKTAFSQRRKKIVKPLGQNFGRENVEAALEKLELRPDIRPGKIDVPTFIELTKLLYPR